jgi:hypothetical protein
VYKQINAGGETENNGGEKKENGERSPRKKVAIGKEIENVVLRHP